MPTQPRMDIYNDVDDPVQAQNRKLLQAHGMLPGPTSPAEVSSRADIERDLMETQMYKEAMEASSATRFYRQAYAQILHLNPDSFSLAHAIFMVENAYLDGKLPAADFDRSIGLRAQEVSQIIGKEGLKRNNLSLNYGIQKLYQGYNTLSVKGKAPIQVPPLRYDFEDIRGDTDYTKMFVSKLLATGKGQCHSLPLLYLLIAERLGVKANLSMAPQHSFVQFLDDGGHRLNFECTNGHLVTDTWMIASGFISTAALQSKIYLDTLSHRQLYSQILADLLLGYLHKFGYDDFSQQLTNKVLDYNPQNLTALIVNANYQTLVARSEINAAGRPKPQDLVKYPAAYQAYQNMKVAVKRVQDLGYQDMPDQAYNEWLASFRQAKQRQASAEIKERLQRQLRQLKTQTHIHQPLN